MGDREPAGQDDAVLIVCGTKKLRQRLGPKTPPDGEPSTTLLGEWYATALLCRPQLILLVNERMLLPLAPAATVPSRIGPEIAVTLAAHQASASVIDGELSQMCSCRSVQPPTAASSAS